MKNPYEKIIHLLDDSDIKYEILEHAAVYTSEQAAKIRGTSLAQGAKALLLKTGDQFTLAVLPGNKRLDSKKLRKVLSVKKLRFATPEEVKEVMGCEIGACYPIGKIIGVRMIVDKSLAKNKIISFNPGIHTKSIKMKYRDYKTVARFKTADIIQ
ncbi:hypothetical protein CMO96_04145 [Candidatus Woesebacteria bacterium]|nr:hypothetical protein [Candidatus Woesebacteria bacterium]|tara:strand:+ start:303 stop:767 length:465 start_codon:yes stop_codon:yes gene_type:complete